MNGAEVDRLLLCLPDDNAFIRALFPNERWRTAAPGDRLRVRWNPQLLGDMAQAHAQAGQPLPELDLPQDLRRAYAFLADPNSSDESMALVHMLHLPDPLETLLEADLIDAALICEDLTHLAIAGLFRYDPEVIRLEEQLFFNYRDRRSEGLYVAAHMFGSSRLDSPGSNLKRLAYRTRNSHWVLSAAGILRPAEAVLPPEILADHIERDLLRLAIAGLRKNLLSRSANPALALVEKYLLPLRQKAKAVEVLCGLQLNQDDMGVLYTELNERLALLRGTTKDATSSNELKNLYEASSHH